MVDHKEVKKLLLEDFNGSFGTFSSKITGAFGLALISEKEYKECHTLRKIRNHFAHVMQASFADDNVKSLLQNLAYAMESSNARTRYLTATVGLIFRLVNRPAAISEIRRTWKDWGNTGQL